MIAGCSRRAPPKTSSSSPRRRSSSRRGALDAKIGRGDLRRSRPATTSTASSSSSRPPARRSARRRIPPGKVKFDETFQKNVETYRDAVHDRGSGRAGAAPSSASLVTSQGCADAGLCYPPMQSAAAIGLAGFGGDGTARGRAAGGRRRLGAAARAPAQPTRESAPPRLAPDSDRHRRRAARRLVLADRRRVLHRRPAALADAVRAADAADPVVDHRRPRRAGLARARLRARAALFARHGARLHRLRRGRRPRRRRPGRGAAEPVGARRVRARPGGAVAVDVRRLRAAAAVGVHRPRSPTPSQTPAGRPRRRRVRDGRRLGADRQPVRRRAARRRACSTSARRATSGSAAPRCSRSPPA